MILISPEGVGPKMPYSHETVPLSSGGKNARQNRAESRSSGTVRAAAQAVEMPKLSL
jgi:hypothetical protein